MCMHCDAEAITLLVNVLPGYSLMQATVDANGWPAGYYGLGQMNNPYFVFPAPLVADPFGNGEPESDDWTPEQNAQYAKSRIYISEIKKNFKTDPVTGWKFVNACMERGYHLKDGSVVDWFINYAAELLSAK